MKEVIGTRIVEKIEISSYDYYRHDIKELSEEDVEKIGMDNIPVKSIITFKGEEYLAYKYSFGDKEMSYHKLNEFFYDGNKVSIAVYRYKNDKIQGERLAMLPAAVDIDQFNRPSSLKPWFYELLMGIVSKKYPEYFI